MKDETSSSVKKEVIGLKGKRQSKSASKDYSTFLEGFHLICMIYVSLQGLLEGSQSKLPEQFQ
jgi:hypothetical protein